MSNKDVILGYYKEVVNGKDFTVLDKYFHPDYLSGALPYIGMGVGLDASSGDKVVVNHVYSEGPSAGKLEVGDEILFVQDGDSRLETFEEIRDIPWGWGKVDSPFMLRVQRGEEEIEVEITRGIIEGLKMSLEEFKESWEKFATQKIPDEKVEILYIIEEGDMVACLATATAMHLDYDRQYLVPGGEFFRLKDNKIIESWGVSDNLAFIRQMGFSVEEPKKIMQST